jgi:predicted 5'-methylthioadenosine/S-adenosylhomocysteine nucleosidase
VLVVAATERELAHIRRVEAFVCGIGPVEAAATVAARLAVSPVDAVLHVGIAGSRSLPPLTVVLGEASVYEDLRAAVPVVDRIEPDASLLAHLRAALPDATVTAIGTSAAVGGGACDVEAMEGFGVLRACALAGVPAVELRVISNSPGDPDRANWRFEEAFELLGETLDRLDVV